MSRLDQYKHQGSTVEGIRSQCRRKETELRREKREQLLSLKRVRLGESDEQETTITTQQVTEAALKLQKKSEDRGPLLVLLRRAFSQSSKLIDAFLGVEGCMQCMVTLLTGTDSDLQLGATWCLTNISSSTDSHAKSVIKHAGPYLVTYLGSGNAPLQDQCAWCIGNLAGGCQSYRNTLEAQGVLLPLVHLLQSDASSVVQSAAFALSNLARSGQKTKSKLVDGGVLTEICRHLVYREDNMDVLREVTWLLTHFTCCDGEFDGPILAAGILERLISVLDASTQDTEDRIQITTPTLRCLVISADHIDEPRCNNLIPVLERCLHSKHPHVQKECLWVLSNILCNPVSHRQVTENKLPSHILGMLSSDMETVREAACCLCNLASRGNGLCEGLLDAGALQKFLPLLNNSDLDTVHMALCFTVVMLRDTHQGNAVFERSGGVQRLESLQFHSEDYIQSQSSDVLGTFFPQQAGLESPSSDITNGTFNT